MFCQKERKKERKKQVNISSNWMNKAEEETGEKEWWRERESDGETQRGRKCNHLQDENLLRSL